MPLGQFASMNDCGFLRQYARPHFSRDDLAHSPPPQSVHMPLGQLTIMNDCDFLRQYARPHFPRDDLAHPPPPQSIYEMV